MKKIFFKLLFIISAVLVFNSIILIRNCQCHRVQKFPDITSHKNTFKKTGLTIDTVTLKYFPLAAGNAYKYFFGFSSGVYFYSLTAEGFSETKRMVMIR